MPRRRENPDPDDVFFPEGFDFGCSAFGRDAEYRRLVRKGLALTGCQTGAEGYARRTMAERNREDLLPIPKGPGWEASIKEFAARLRRAATPKKSKKSKL